MERELRDRIIRALTDEQSTLRADFGRLVVDFTLSRPVEDLVDPTAFKDLVLGAMTEENLRRIVQRHVAPGFERYDATIRAAEQTVGSFVPEAARPQLLGTVARVRVPRGRWTQGAVEPALIRRLLAPVFQQVLLSFAARLSVFSGPASSGSAAREGSGLAGRIGRQVQQRAGRLVDAGKNVMGGLGAEMERRIGAAVREFSDGATTLWRDALRDRLRSDEGRALLEEITRQSVEHVLRTRLAEIHEDVESLPMDAVLELLPSLMARGAAHELVHRIVDDELRAFLAVEGRRPLGELLEELGIAREVAAGAAKQVDALARTFFSSEQFGHWLERLLES